MFDYEFSIVLEDTENDRALLSALIQTVRSYARDYDLTSVLASLDDAFDDHIEVLDYESKRNNAN